MRPATHMQTIDNYQEVPRPAEPAEASRSRFVIALFIDADTPTMLSSLPQFNSATRPARYQPITSGDYKAMRLGAQTSI